MAISKTWPSGADNPTPASFSIPEAGEKNWSSLTNFLTALAGGTQTTTFQKIAIRQATTTPVTVTTNDCLVSVKLSSPGAVAVDLPAGSPKQMFFIYDETGDAGTNNITINRAGSDTIEGSSTIVIDSNNEMIGLCFDSVTSQWKAFVRCKPNVNASDISGLGAGIATWLATPSSANLAAAVTDETGSGALVFANSPAFTTPNIGTPSAGNLSNCTALPISALTGSGLDAAKIADGSVSDTEFQHLDGLTGDIQPQLNAKLDDSQLIDDDTFATATSTNIPSAESVKAYVDNLDSENAKTADNESITGVYTFDEAIGTKQVVTPSNPSAGYMKVYTKSDNKLYTLDSSGTERDVAAGAGEATASTQGLVTSYTPAIQSAIHTVTNANYTVLDDDGYSTILVSGGGSDRTITLPTLADNVGRTLTIMRIDAPSSGLPKIIIDAEGSETIDGALTTEIGKRYDNVYTGQWASITLRAGATQWHVIATTNDVIYSESSAVWGTSVTNANTIVIPAGRWEVTLFSYRSSGTDQTNISLSLNTTSATHLSLIHI